MESDRYVRPGECVYKPGDMDENCYIVLSGSVELARAGGIAGGPLGTEMVERVYGLGRCFGEIGLLDKKPRRTMTRVVRGGDGADLMVISRKDYETVQTRALEQRVKGVLETPPDKRELPQVKNFEPRALKPQVGFLDLCL